MLEAELNFTETIDDVNSVIESMLQHVTRDLLDKHIEDLHCVWLHKQMDNKEVKMVGESKCKQLLML